MFLNGMKKSLQDQVMRKRPMGMDEIVDIAKVIEELEAEKPYVPKPFARTTSAPVLAIQNRSFGQNSRANQEYSPTRRSFKVNWSSFTNTEPRKGVLNPCRHYRESFFMGHRCKGNQRFKCLELEEGNGNEEMEEQNDEEEGNEQGEVVEVQGMQRLSLRSMTGFDGKSVRMKARI